MEGEEGKGEKGAQEGKANSAKSSGNQILDLKYTQISSLPLPHHTHLHSVGIPDTSSAMVTTKGKVS